MHLFRTLFWMISSVVGVVVILYYAFYSDNFDVYNQAEQLQPQVNELFSPSSTLQLQPNKIILFWTKFFGKEDFIFGRGRAPFANCQHNQRSACLATSDRGLLNDSDAILFHGRDLNPNDLPQPGWRLPHQQYIFVLYESPMNTDLDMLSDKFRNYFNRTMTYRRDSDIVDLVSGRIKCNNTSTSRSTCRDFPLSASTQGIFNFQSAPIKMDLFKKNRTIAWFVSNCFTYSKREQLVHNLARHIPVDVYGQCYNNSCPIGDEDCNYMLRQYYRFYLSFENSLCPDYVTEKVYRAMVYDTVPVVFGGADYSLFLPVGSYVNAMDFDSPLELANYLKKLMVDDNLYLSYFLWKEQYVVQTPSLDGVCRLCYFLSDQHATKQKTYSDIEAWWSGRISNQTCFPPPTSLVAQV